jgi:hypothetical protein
MCFVASSVPRRRRWDTFGLILVVNQLKGSKCFLRGSGTSLHLDHLKLSNNKFLKSFHRLERLSIHDPMNIRIADDGVALIIRSQDHRNRAT